MIQTCDCYVAVKGADLAVPMDDVLVNTKKNGANSEGPIQEHMHNMLALLHTKDTLKMAVKLESVHLNRNRYLAIVSRNVVEDQEHEECCLLGFDCNQTATIGIVLPIWANTRINLDGDGGFTINTQNHHLIMKPISVQAMWSAYQSLHRASAKANDICRTYNGVTHSWVAEYENKINSDQSCLNEWHFMEDITSRRPPTPDPNKSRPTEREETEIIIRSKLKDVMMSVDLDEVTCKFLRISVEEALNMDLQDYRKFINEEMLNILGQLDAPTKIFDHLFLGSEWNASNSDELKSNGISHILNITREIDNFFPGMFEYTNVRVYDEEKTDLLKYWNQTFKYIDDINKEEKRCLVHCKMGKSRSASVVIAYVMKMCDYSLETALEFVKMKRNCIKPNDGFLKQLEIYEGILDASRQRHSLLWRSKSETNLDVERATDDSTNPCSAGGKGIRRPRTPDYDDNFHSKISKDGLYLDIPGNIGRPKSWSPDEKTARMIFTKSEPSSPVSLHEYGELTIENMDSCTSSLQPVVSIKDRITELKSVQQTSYAKESESSAVSRSGLVLNLANQFEAVSKPNTPSPNGDEVGCSIIYQFTKPPVVKHEAVLVKPKMCSEFVTPYTNEVVPPESKSPLRSQSSTSIDSGVSCQSKAVEMQRTAKSVPLIEAINPSVCLSPKIISKYNIDSINVARSASNNSVPSYGLCLSPTDWQGSQFTYEKEDIPWTPGTVQKTKEQIEENSLKRTKSFDSALKLKLNEFSPCDESANQVQRSQSLSAQHRGFKCSPTLSPPKPPVRTTSIKKAQRVMHSISSPSLPVSSNSPCPQKSSSSSSISETRLLSYSSDEILVMPRFSVPKSQHKSIGSITKSRTIWYDTDEKCDSIGVVKRLTQELEAKSAEPQCRNRIKSENFPSDESEFQDIQRSSSTGSVSHKNKFGQKKGDITPFRVITSHNFHDDPNLIPAGKPPPASKSCRKLRKHQQDYGKNHPVNKIASQTRPEAITFKVV